MCISMYCCDHLCDRFLGEMLKETSINHSGTEFLSSDFSMFTSQLPRTQSEILIWRPKCVRPVRTNRPDAEQGGPWQQAVAPEGLPDTWQQLVGKLFGHSQQVGVPNRTGVYSSVVRGNRKT